MMKHSKNISSLMSSKLESSQKEKRLQFGMSYRETYHETLPHVLKFSGGRSSGMMLMNMLKKNLLKQSRGDVVVFNNTSAEHQKTYEFVSKCKTFCEAEFGIPFFIVEYCTYEDAYQGEYIRMPTFRLANGSPHSQSNPDGYRWRGEVFEELLSLNGVLPSIFQRTCTIALKLETTRKFLKEWFLNKPLVKRRGHFGKTSRINIDELHRRHLKNRGEVPKEVYEQKKNYVLKQPHFRESQKWAKFSSAHKKFFNKLISNQVFGDHLTFGKDKVEYVGVVGLRSDEKLRVQKVLMKSSSENENNDYSGEIVYTPLYHSGVSSQDVLDYWNNKEWNLDIDPEQSLSNCTYCFLKGVNNLRSINRFFHNNSDQLIPNTPSDINWWKRIEDEYAKDFSAEGKTPRTTIPDNLIGFFGAQSGYLYKYIISDQINPEIEQDYPSGFIPCECTE